MEVAAVVNPAHLGIVEVVAPVDSGCAPHLFMMEVQAGHPIPIGQHLCKLGDRHPQLPVPDVKRLLV